MEIQDLKTLALKLTKFGITGIISTLVYVFLSYLFIWHVHFEPVVSNTIAYILAIPISFFGQKYFTFKSSGAVKTEAPRFIALQLTCLLASIIITFFCGSVFKLHPAIGIALVVVIIPLISYSAMTLLIFRQPTE